MTQNWNTLKWKVSVFVANRPSFTKNNEEISKFLKAKGKWSPTEAWFHNEEHYVVNSVSMHNKNSQQSRCRWSVPQHNKGYTWQALSKLQWYFL